MAATIPGGTGTVLLLGTYANGQTIGDKAMRLGQISKASVISDPTTALKARSGIIPGAGNPLDVVALTTTSVTVKAGTYVGQATTSSTDGVLCVTLTADTAIDTITGDGTNPRIDVVVIEVVTGSDPVIKRVTGTAAASPTRPSLTPGSPSTTTWFPLAQLRVEKSTTPGITITKLANVDGVYTCAPGGSVRGITRQWTFARTTDDSIAPGVTNGTAVTVTVPSAEAVPGIYKVTVNACFRVTGGSGTNDCRVALVTPGRTTTRFYREATGAHFQVDCSDEYVLQTGPGAGLTFTLSFSNNTGTNSISTIGADPNATITVTRIQDL